jgi:hypothetical protein
MRLTKSDRPGRGLAARGTTWAAPWLALAWLLASAGPAASQDVPLGRHGDLPCGACHDADRAQAAPPGEAAALCARCHAETTDQHGGTNHPSGFVPSRPLPAEFPLDERGRMTCITCHALHGGATALLRGIAPRTCTPCHAK